MSFNSSIQQLAAGAASFVASLVVGRSAGGELTRYWMIGILSARGRSAASRSPAGCARRKRADVESGIGDGQERSGDRRGRGAGRLLTALALAKQDVSVAGAGGRTGAYDRPASGHLSSPFARADGALRHHRRDAQDGDQRCRAGRIRDRREGVIVEWDVSEIGDLTPYPYRLHLEQHRLTPIILSKLMEYPNARCVSRTR